MSSNENGTVPPGAFDDVFEANASYAETYSLAGLKPVAARGLALVTCMDSRIEPLQMLGLKPGDAKILRNAGARVTDDTLRTLVLAVYLLGVDRVLILPHTNCKMASVPGDDTVHDLIQEEYGVDTRSLEFHTNDDQLGALAHDLERIRHHPLLPAGLPVTGAIYDVDTGRVAPTGL
ncbi:MULTISPECIES: beta-class carbonic anhydrase [Nocardiopsis]|uniref:carbonic anhydrase n=2 Tax=Nocardiopsis alba TaxID=53437 RepID=A0A7K2ING6_9ACTN|nr:MULTISPECIES: carbonic anhydrase [Nocardiopsis]AFR10054.1 carbonic anhydrase family protein [Nocardiopsis alba ATCC BAA-2165]MEC3893888.1 carbonic anhydrase [Nocardiopsis sp. LDBS1602]MYR31508.1 carbonic anhydrase [Nocardiopsis alba]